ncbi:hypothetical protein [Paenibacillus medicaginis]|uniref:Phage protein n=1 Tax=Paenibacillus medicaginis TaxID=1470560 RepID=A0ABV5C0W7_9BACL
MVDKVKLTKAQAGHIAGAKAQMRPEQIVMLQAHEHDWLKWTELNDMDLDTLIKAVYIGYEVELTVQERLKEAFDTTTGSDGCYYGEIVAEANGFHAGFKTALDIVGMTVPGIND